jgi:hypothetical protein
MKSRRRVNSEVGAVYKMEVYVKDKTGAQKVYWIRRRKKLVAGWFAPAKLLNESLGASQNASVDIHFTYPPDGNLHYSLKFIDPDTGVQRFDTVYHDHIRRKLIEPNNRHVSEAPRTEEDSGWEMLMPHFKPNPIDDYARRPECFCFGSNNIPIADGCVSALALNRLPKLADVPEGVVPVDIDHLGTGTLHIEACLYGANYPSAWPRERIIWFCRDETAYPHIELYAMFTAAS